MVKYYDVWDLPQNNLSQGEIVGGNVEETMAKSSS